MTGLRAITVCVDYADILAVTLPRNLKHFDDVCIVTDRRSEAAVREVIADAEVPDSDRPAWGVKLFVTDAFYENGATFNKWIALERALDWFVRRGWLCHLDADVVWPAAVRVNVFGESLRFDHPQGACVVNRGQLMTPLRRMWDSWPTVRPEHWNGIRAAWERTEQGHVLPSEQMWDQFPVHNNVKEWAGYSQVFHAEDPALGPPPWHETDWKHAGGADSVFQAKWPRSAKVRPPWEVLHLGPAGHNWLGRATTRADGSRPEGADERLAAIYGPEGLWARRRAIRARGGSPAEAFRPEKLEG